MCINYKKLNETTRKDHLSHSATSIRELPIDELFLNDELLTISHQVTPWYADLGNF